MQGETGKLEKRRSTQRDVWADTNATHAEPRPTTSQ